MSNRLREPMSMKTIAHWMDNAYPINVTGGVNF